MSKKTGYLLGMLLTIIICMILAYFFCCGAGIGNAVIDDSPDDDRNAVVADPSPTSLPFNLNDPDGSFAFNSNDNFNFNTSSFSILTPTSEEINGGIKQLKVYFENPDNENKKIDIIGYFDEGEENPSAYENLGLARSNAIKNYLVEQGISSERINTYGKLKDSLIPDGDVYKGPISYTMYTQAAEDKEEEIKELTKVADAIKEDPLVLHFEHAESSVDLSEEQRLKIGNMSRYLDKVNGSSITIEGHTDSAGKDATNNRLGKERADFAKAYFVSNGIPDSKIKTVSKGEREPITSNDTEEGKSKNRRAVVTIN